MRLSGLKAVLAKLSAIVFLTLILWGCGRVPQLTETAPPLSRLPFVKVLLEQQATSHAVEPSQSDEMAIDCYKRGKRLTFYSRLPVTVAVESDNLAIFSDPQTTLEFDIDYLIIGPRHGEGALKYDGREYRGLLELTPVSGQIRLVNVIYVEDYLKGVVPLEIGPTPKEEFEAIKAQAVAARTYAMSHLGQFGDEAGYDLKDDITDQVYEGVAVEDELVSAAVEATRGEVAVCQDRMINAYYHSTCGGATDDIEDVWNKDPQPYLVMVTDEGACRQSKYFTWQEKFTADQVILRLEQYLAREHGREVDAGWLLDVRIMSRTPGGRVASITFETTSGPYEFDKEIVRWVLRRSDGSESILRSARFDLELRHDDRGEVSEIILDGSGYGHGVGMCQMGARGMAAAGVTYQAILAHYYHGTELKRLY